MNKQQIKTTIEDLSRGYSDSMRSLPIWSEIMQKADEVGHFCSGIVENAVLNRKPISEKQAWVVAFFAEKNNLINT
jgi:hypothetical protein